MCIYVSLQHADVDGDGDRDVDGDVDVDVVARFHSGPPYEDVAFKIINHEWEIGRKSGFKCVFERGVLQLYFNFKRHRYRR